MEKILDFLHLSLGEKAKKSEIEEHSIAGAEAPKIIERSQRSVEKPEKIDKAFQFPEVEEITQAQGAPTGAGVGAFICQEESQQTEEVHTRRPGKNVAVKNLPRQLKKGELEKILSGGPKPKNITFVRNNGKFHGMVLIKYPTAQDASLAVTTLNGSLVKGKPIIVEYKKKTKKDKPKSDKPDSESASDSPSPSPSPSSVQASWRSDECKSDTERTETDSSEKFVIPFRRHSIAYPNSMAWRRNSVVDSKFALLRRNSIACFKPESWSESLPAFSPSRQPKGPEDTSKGFSAQYRNTRKVTLVAE